jgi:3-hydroxyisobutyrate dehydrogenase
LSIMAGGRKETVERASRILQAMGKTLIHVGGAGAGHAVKALNNYVSAAGLIAVSEALVAAEKFGIDPHLVNQVFNASTGRNNTTERKVEEFMLSKRYDSGFALALMRKDVETAAQFIDGMGTPGRFARECLGVATAAEEALGAGADHTAVHAYFAGQVSA